ncbi:hypothetical protein WJX81_004415 [Elliptochloris bilobata]|uniref:Vacuolar protein sorting-associated protein 51 homolog n=1 Tax=Elliptochloris bilobata TaxID=381761 RepID=A0AAW1RSJ5_9CHLO
MAPKPSPTTPRSKHSRNAVAFREDVRGDGSSGAPSPPDSPMATPVAPTPATKKRGLRTPSRKINALFKRSVRADKGGGVAGHQRASSEGGTLHTSRGMRLGGLAAFEAGTVDLDNDLSGLTEKGIDTLRAELAALDGECAEELRKAVHANYTHFISASQGIIKLEGDTGALRNLLANAATLMVKLKEVAAPPPAPLAATVAEEAAAASSAAGDWEQSPDGLRWADALDEIEVALAERQPLDALHAVRRADKLVPRLSAAPPADIPPPAHIALEARVERQRAEMDARRQRLAALADAALSDALAAGGTDLRASSVAAVRAAAGVLAAAAGGAHAARRLLDAHSARLRRLQQQLLKPQNAGGGDADGVEYAGALAQSVFRALAAAADDTAALSSASAPELSSLLVVWALQETERFALLLKRHALAPFAAPAGLAATVSCCLLALVHCRALEVSHGLTLAPRLMRDLWPACEQVLQRRLRRLVEEVRTAAAEDTKTIAAAMGAGSQSGSQLLPAAQLVLGEIQTCVRILTPLAGPRMAAALRQANTDLFGVYAEALAGAFEGRIDESGALPPALSSAVQPAIEQAAALSEDALPKALAPLHDSCGVLCDAGALQEHLAQLVSRLGPYVV